MEGRDMQERRGGRSTQEEEEEEGRQTMREADEEEEEGEEGLVCRAIEETRATRRTSEVRPKTTRMTTLTRSASLGAACHVVGWRYLGDSADAIHAVALSVPCSPSASPPRRMTSHFPPCPPPPEVSTPRASGAPPLTLRKVVAMVTASHKKQDRVKVT